MHAPTTYFTGQPSTKVSPKGVSQFGGSYGDHATGSGKVLRGAVEPVKVGSMPVGGPGGVPLGNQTALTAGQGAGAGRTVSRRGSQQGVSPSTPIGPTKDTLGEFGNDSPNVRGRR